MKRFVFRPAASADIERAYAWYEKERPGLGDDFLTEIRMTVDSILAAPKAYPVVHRKTRRALVRRFPYGLFFRQERDVVAFVACFHTRRNPRSWMRRR